MGHVSGISRDQGTLFPERLDDLIAADSRVRVIDAFVDCLDLGSLGFAHVAAPEQGARRTTRRICSSSTSTAISTGCARAASWSSRARTTSRCCGWSTAWRRASRTIATSRAMHGEALRGACRSFAVFCRQAGPRARRAAGGRRR
ncbi:MAG: hypothetical protein U5K43_10370 [Halofilum sp. (in: g-proteobacteria)]|nr:hypothetical protein [Halofilum sp. (in: g-proteobacteria)]